MSQHRDLHVLRRRRRTQTDHPDNTSDGEEDDRANHHSSSCQTSIIAGRSTDPQVAPHTGWPACSNALLAGLRKRYDDAVHWGMITNRHRDWPNGNHPGYNLAKRLHDKADQVWLFTRQLAVPWTNNASEQALKAPQRHQAVSGYWHTTTTLADYCRIRSYLTTARNHGLRAIEAIHAAPTRPALAPDPRHSLTSA